MDRQRLEGTARSLVAENRGILAADESTGTIAKRFQALGVASAPETRRDYRFTLFTTPGLGQWVSGAILYEETLRQDGPDGRPLRETLRANGVQPGIKVDTGAKELANHPGEKVTEGLDGLRERLREFAALGATFAKWRAVITIGTGPAGRAIPSDACISANAHALARYAALCQEAGIVPIVEPEVLMDGGHSVEVCEDVTRRTWIAVFDELHRQGVHLPGILLKPSMVVSGAAAKERAGPQEVAERTVALLRACVPAAVPGIVFLSGGQTPEEATDHLARMNRLGPHPWALSFSYGRALQEPALQAWRGDNANRAKAQAALAERAKANSRACEGKLEAGAVQAR